MPRVYKRTSSRGSWTQESLQNAIKAILEESNADWIKSILCSKWLHETCSVHDNLCSLCGRKEKKRMRDEKRAVQ